MPTCGHNSHGDAASLEVAKAGCNKPVVLHCCGSLHEIGDADAVAQLMNNDISPIKCLHTAPNMHAGDS